MLTFCLSQVFFLHLGKNALIYRMLLHSTPSLSLAIVFISIHVPLYYLALKMACLFFSVYERALNHCITASHLLTAAWLLVNLCNISLMQTQSFCSVLTDAAAPIINGHQHNCLEGNLVGMFYQFNQATEVASLLGK